MSSDVTFERTPAEIEANITATRASLDRKLEHLETRLSPRARLNEMKARIRPQEYLGLAAVAAIATGATMAVRGLRRPRHDEPIALDDAAVAALMCDCE